MDMKKKEKEKKSGEVIWKIKCPHEGAFFFFLKQPSFCGVKIPLNNNVPCKYKLKFFSGALNVLLDIIFSWKMFKDFRTRLNHKTL